MGIIHKESRFFFKFIISEVPDKKEKKAWSVTSGHSCSHYCDGVSWTGLDKEEKKVDFESAGIRRIE